MMNLQKRECPVKMRLIPYGGGWTDVYVDFGDGELYFIISYGFGDSFNTLMKALFHLYPEQSDVDEADELVDYKVGICDLFDDEYVVKTIVDDIDDCEVHRVVQYIPWKASFTWDEEGGKSHWTIERAPNLNKFFGIKISIEMEHDETDEKEHHEYEVAYEDMCYAVADACTKAIKKHGICGYYHSVYYPDINLRHLLFLKSVALGNFEAIELTHQEEKGQGETSDFQKELELLQFDM